MTRTGSGWFEWLGEQSFCEFAANSRGTGTGAVSQEAYLATLRGAQAFAALSAAANADEDDTAEEDVDLTGSPRS